MNYTILMLKSHYSPYSGSTLSFLNELGEIYVWGSFKIPSNGTSKESPSIIWAPEKINFLFDKSLGMKIKTYEISDTQIGLIAMPSNI
jgi:hypothetical protein